MEMLKNKLIELVRLFEGQRDKNYYTTPNYESNRLSRLAIELELYEIFGLRERQVIKMIKFLIINDGLIVNDDCKRNMLNIRINS